MDMYAGVANGCSPCWITKGPGKGSPEVPEELSRAVPFLKNAFISIG
jgi:hypothetical protein